MKPRLIFTALCFLCLSEAAQAQLLLTNGDFDQDLSGWVLPSAPDTTATWQADGNPVGSLRIESSWAGSPPANPLNVYSDCFEIVEGTYHLQGDVRAELGFGAEGCHLDLEIWTTPDCTGPSLARTFNETTQQGIWEPLELSGELSGSGGSAFRVSLTLLKYPSAATTTCSFDNVVLRGPNPLPHEVPTLEPAAVVLLVIGLGLAAMAALRARSG